MNKKYICINLCNGYETFKEMLENEIEFAFEELEEVICDLDLSDSTIQKIIGVLVKDEKNLLDTLMFGVVEEDTSNKETPKKVDTSVYSMFKCPTCGNPFLDRRENYCCDCGQKLDWGK